MPFNKEVFLIAAKNGAVAVLETQLQEKNAKIDACGDNGQTALFLAAACGQKKAVEFLIGRGAGLSLEQTVPPYNTPLLIALKNGRQEIAELLLKQAGDIGIDRKDVEGNTALHLALEKGYNDLAQKMIEKGADPFIENNAKQVPATYPFLIEILKKNFCPSTFVKAAGRGDLPILQAEAAKSGFNVNAYAKVSDYYETALTAATNKGQIDAVSFLLKQPGIALSLPSRDRSCLTASALAGYRNYQEILRLMIAAGINEGEQYQALKQSVRYGNFETAKYLIDEVGLNVNHIYKRGNEMIPLILLLFDERNPSKDILRFLLAKGVKDLGLVVRRVADYQDGEYLSIVLKYCADVNEADPKNGYTALMLAAQAGNLENVRLLLRQGADPFAKNKKGETAFDLANPDDYQVFKKKKIKYTTLEICQQYQARLDIQAALLQAGIKRKKSWRIWEIAGAVVTGLIGAFSAGFAALNYFGLTTWLGSTAAGFIAAVSIPLWLNFILLGVGALLMITAVGLGMAAIINKIACNTLLKQLEPINQFNEELFIDALTFLPQNKAQCLPRREVLHKQLQNAKHYGNWQCRDIQDGRYYFPPLIYAARIGDAVTVASLLDAGVAIESHDVNLYTALDYAVLLKNEEVVKILLQCGAIISANVEKVAADSSPAIQKLLQNEMINRSKRAEVINSAGYMFEFKSAEVASGTSDKAALLAHNNLRY